MNVGFYYYAQHPMKKMKMPTDVRIRRKKKWSGRFPRGKVKAYGWIHTDERITDQYWLFENGWVEGVINQ